MKDASKYKMACIFWTQGLTQERIALQMLKGIDLLFSILHAFGEFGVCISIIVLMIAWSIAQIKTWENGCVPQKHENKYDREMST